MGGGGWGGVGNTGHGTIYIYIYNECVYTWNPNDPCFELNGKAFSWRVQNPKVEDKQVPHRHISF